MLGSRNWCRLWNLFSFKLFLVLTNSIWPTNFFLKESCCAVDGLTFDEFLKLFSADWSKIGKKCHLLRLFGPNVDVVVRSHNIQISVVYLVKLPALIPNVDNAVEEKLIHLNWYMVINCYRLWLRGDHLDVISKLIPFRFI